MIITMITIFATIKITIMILPILIIVVRTIITT